MKGRALRKLDLLIYAPPYVVKLDNDHSYNLAVTSLHSLSLSSCSYPFRHLSSHSLAPPTSVRVRELRYADIPFDSKLSELRPRLHSQLRRNFNTEATRPRVPSSPREISPTAASSRGGRRGNCKYHARCNFPRER